jgi:hypothetical protein
MHLIRSSVYPLAESVGQPAHRKRGFPPTAIGLALWVALAFALPLFRAPHDALAQATEPIRVLETAAQNDYPNGLTFTLHAEADRPLAQIEVYYRTQGSGSTTRQPVAFEPGQEVLALYTWDTSRITVAPSTPVIVYWKLADEDGNRLTTPEQTVYYDDLRYEWREIRDPKLIVRWYEGDEAFGRFVYQTAQAALRQMETSSGQELALPVFVLLYANDEDFGSWHSYVDRWVGGQAFPPLGVTAEIVPPNADRAWIEDVLPHEIAHLFFYQALRGGMSSWPAWLDEGLAQYYEFGSPDAALDRAARAARQGALLPLSSLSGGFGRDPEQVRLSYDQSLSAVTYLLETWGDAGLQGLLDVFRQGKSPRVAVQEALGITWEQFEAGWITWMGVPTTPAAPPTPTATLVWPTAPSGWPTPTRKATVSATRKATASATPRAAPSATRSPASTPQPTPSPGVTPSPASPSPTPAGTASKRPSGLPCVSAAPLLALGLLLYARRGAANSARGH